MRSTTPTGVLYGRLPASTSPSAAADGRLVGRPPRPARRGPRGRVLAGAGAGDGGADRGPARAARSPPTTGSSRRATTSRARRSASGTGRCASRATGRGWSTRSALVGRAVRGDRGADAGGDRRRPRRRPRPRGRDRLPPAARLDRAPPARGQAAVARPAPAPVLPRVADQSSPTSGTSSRRWTTASPRPRCCRVPAGRWAHEADPRRRGRCGALAVGVSPPACSSRQQLHCCASAFG